MKVKYKYLKRLYNGEKIPRKAKKVLIGTKPTRKALKERIAKVVIETINPFDNGYTYQYPSDDFCPYCGCDISRSTGNMAGYPEDWTQHYCIRCGEMIFESDNGNVWHALMDFKGGAVC